MKTTSGFSGLLIVVIIIAIGLTGTLGWVAWRSHTSKTNNTSDAPPSHIQQGVKGTITIRSGNCQPFTSSSCQTGLYTTPTTIIIKQSITDTDKTQKRVVKQIDNVKGTFETDLAPGLYNMYVIVGGHEYCNLFGGHNGEDCEFPVMPGTVTPYELQINNAID